jgi:PiT family inorganic phosphate transporter
VIDSGGLIGSKSSLPVGILLVGGVGIVFGLVTYGHKVIATIGTAAVISINTPNTLSIEVK